MCEESFEVTFTLDSPPLHNDRGEYWGQKHLSVATWEKTGKQHKKITKEKNITICLLKTENLQNHDGLVERTVRRRERGEERKRKERSWKTMGEMGSLYTCCRHQMELLTLFCAT